MEHTISGITLVGPGPGRFEVAVDQGLWMDGNVMVRWPLDANNPTYYCTPIEVALETGTVKHSRTKNSDESFFKLSNEQKEWLESVKPLLMDIAERDVRIQA